MVFRMENRWTAMVNIPKTKNEIDPTASRRVEFRIVTSGEEVLENFVNKNAEYDGQ